MSNRAQAIKPAAKQSGDRPRVLAWVFYLVVVGIAGLSIGRYRIDNSMHRWMPELAGQKIAQTYIVIGGSAERLNTAELARTLNALPEVLTCLGPEVITGPTTAPYPVTGYGPGPGRMFGDTNYTGLFCFPREDVDTSAFLQAVRSAIDNTLGVYADEVALGGPAVFTQALNDWSQRRLPAISVSIVLLGGLLLACLTGRIRAAVAASCAIVCSQIILVGLMSRLGVAMDMVLSMVSPLMMSLGYSFAAHRILRRNVAGTLAWCAATTAAGILGFVFSGFPPIRSFAVWGALGLLITWGSVMGLIRHEPHARYSALPPRRLTRRAVRLLYVCAYHHPARVILIAMLPIAASCLSLPYLNIQNDPIHYFPNNSRVYRDYIELDSRLIGMLPFEVEVRSTGVISDVVAKHDVPDAGEMLRRTPGVQLVVEPGLPDRGGVRRYLGVAGSEALPGLAAAQVAWHDWADAHHVSIRWIGVAAQLNAVAEGMVRVSATAFPAMVFLAGGVVWLISGRGLRVALIGAAVNLLPIAVLIPVMALAHLPLSLPSLMIGSIAVGIAIDDTLHLTAAMKQKTDHRRTWRRCLQPCAGSSLIAAACMACFMLAPFRPTAEFGALMSLAIISALAADLIVLPAALTLTGTIAARSKTRSSA